MGSKRGRLRAHALRRGGLSASVPTLTRRLLGLTFIYYPTPRAAPLRGLPWAIVLSPRSAGLLNSAHLRFAAQLYKLAVFLIIPTGIIHHQTLAGGTASRGAAEDIVGVGALRHEGAASMIRHAGEQVAGGLIGSGKCHTIGLSKHFAGDCYLQGRPSGKKIIDSNEKFSSYIVIVQ